jgi:hypothetical protein
VLAASPNAPTSVQLRVHDVGDFVVHVLEQQVKHLEAGEDEAAVRKRLQGLGYID